MGNNLFSRLALSVGMIVGAMSILGYGFRGQEQNIDWERMEIAARTYINYPLTENARLFYQSLSVYLPAGKAGEIDRERWERVANFIFDNLEVLARQIWAGDRDAVRVGFRLYSFFGGYYTMRLDAMMADLIRFQPQLFLEELKSSPNAQLLKSLGFPLCESDIDFGRGDREMALRHELEMRIKALESVTDSALTDLRDTCIKEIRAFLTKYYHDSPITVLGEKEYLPLFKKAAIYVYHQVETANQVCQCIKELEWASNSGRFGATSEKIVRSSGLYDELTALQMKSREMLEVLENPPLLYIEEFSALGKMVCAAYMLCECAKNPSVVTLDSSLDSYNKSIVFNYDRFQRAYSTLITLMPKIQQEVQKNSVDLEAINKRLK
jgi:hypothetical protein